MTRITSLEGTATKEVDLYAILAINHFLSLLFWRSSPQNMHLSSFICQPASDELENISAGLGRLVIPDLSSAKCVVDHPAQSFERGSSWSRHVCLWTLNS